MPRIDPFDYSEDDYITGREARRRKRVARHKAKISLPQVLAQVTDRPEEEEFNFSYNASRHERQWIIDSLEGFYDQKWFSDILRLLKGGKEASVYQCVAGPERGHPYLAAKVYRPTLFRSLKNDHLYREGRANLDADGNEINDDGQLHAIRKRTAYGRELMHTSWIEHEFKTMQTLFAAGADLPEPFVTGNNAILMEYIGGDELPAPTLIEISLERAEAQVLFERVLHNIEIMLSCDRVHGDLSAYNILYWEGRIALIDFPQAIQPEVNRSAFTIFQRDLLRISEYFGRQGVRSDPHRLASQLWKHYGHHLTPEADPALLDAENEADLLFWRKQSNRRL